MENKKKRELPSPSAYKRQATVWPDETAFWGVCLALKCGKSGHTSFGVAPIDPAESNEL